MASNIIRAAIFVFAFGICMSEDVQIDGSKCKYSDEFLNELEDHLQVCMDKIKPGGDVDKVYEEPDYLNEDEHLEFSACIEEQLGITTTIGPCWSIKPSQPHLTMSADKVYSVEKAKEYVNDMRALNDDDIVNAILEGIDKCEKDNDEGVYGIKMMQCVDDAYDKVCEEEEE